MVLTIIVFALTFVNWFIYHKIFTVYYFGGVGKGFLKEFVGSFIVAMLEMALFYMVGGFVLRIVIIIAFAVGIILAIRELFRLVMNVKKVFGKQQEERTEQKKESSQGAEVRKNRTESMYSEEPLKDDTDTVTDEMLLSYANVISHIIEKYVASNPGIDERELFFDFMRTFLNERGKKFNIKENLESRIHCKQCGRAITRGAKFCNFCGASTEEKIVCPKCGKMIAMSAKYCNFCGQTINREG